MGGKNGEVFFVSLTFYFYSFPLARIDELRKLERLKILQQIQKSGIVLRLFFFFFLDLFPSFLHLRKKRKFFIDRRIFKVMTVSEIYLGLF